MLEEILSRAGASDDDRPAWLAERHTGVTATEVRDLWLGARKTQDLIDVKLGRATDPFIATKYTVWGKTREPLIGERVAWSFGIEPEHRVFHAADNPGFLASPDGVAVIGDRLLVGEYKTSNKPIPVGSALLTKKGYVAQMTWVMRVLGATPEHRRNARCLYAWEQHNNDWADVGGRFPEPSNIVRYQESWVDYDEALAAELEDVAVAFLTELHRQAAGEPPAADPEDYEVLVAAYLGAVAARDREDARIQEITAQILDRAGDGQVDPITTRNGRVAFVRPGPRRSFDEAAWARRAPAQHRLWLAAKDRYVKLTPVRASVRVTPPREEAA